MLSRSDILGCQWLPAVLVAGCLTVDHAGAAIETFSGSISPTYTDYNNSLAIQQFDPTLGTLQSVTISVADTAQFKQFYQNLSTSSPSTITISQNLGVTVTLPVSALIISTLNLASGNNSYLLAAYTGTPFFTGTSGGSQTYNDSQSGSLTLGPSGLAPFIGNGVENFQVSAIASGISTITAGNAAVGWSTLAGLGLTVAYEYVAAPEPATWFAGIFAVASLFVIKQRRVKLG